MFDVVRMSFHLIGRARRGRWIALVVLALVASGLEMVGAGIVYTLIALVSNPDGELALPVIGDVMRFFGDGIDQEDLLLGVIVAMATFFLVRAVVQIFIAYAQQRVAHNVGADLAKRLAAGYLALPYAWHLQRNTADLIRNANGAVMTTVGQAFLPMIRVAADSLVVLGLLLVMLLVSPVATGFAILVVGGAALVLLWVVQPRLKRIGASVHAMNRATLKALQQPLHGLRDVKLLGRERSFVNEYGSNRQELARGHYIRGALNEVPRHIMETALIGFILVFLAYAVLTGTASDQVLSTLGVFAYAGLRLQPSLTRVISGLNSIKYSTASVEAVHDDLRLVEGLRPEGMYDPRPFEHDVALKHVSFRYEGADVNALTDVNLTIGHGETIGVCGSTGSGKTTLVDLITGLLEPTDGVIEIDGRHLEDDVRGWQRNLGVVPQMVFLIDDTLRRNIALGVSDEDADDEAIREAVRLAQLDSFIGDLPAGLDTEVGERGVRISGGQRQRIAIARALYRRASVLVFDEGTSALDNTTEAHLMSALEQLRGDHTIILVAHRLSTVRGCDRIVYVEDGRVAGLGTYEQLLQGNQGFQKLAHSS